MSQDSTRTEGASDICLCVSEYCKYSRDHGTRWDSHLLSTLLRIILLSHHAVLFQTHTLQEITFLHVFVAHSLYLPLAQIQTPI